jgi:MoaA/NifB/PqqE/SkfB family radical SAM enzyme
MELDLFKKILDDVGPWALTLQLWDWGEPLVNARILDIIAYARNKGVKVISSSNGHLFAKPGMAEKLVRSGIDTIIFAIDGITQKTCELYRQEGQLETTLEGIRMAVAAKKALGASAPTVNFRFIVMAQNEHEIPLVRELAPTLGVDVLTLKAPRMHRIHTETSCLLRRRIQAGGSFRTECATAGLSLAAKHEQRDKVRYRHNLCKHLWNSPCFHWNGNVSPCTYDPRDQQVLGNMAKSTFARSGARTTTVGHARCFTRTGIASRAATLFPTPLKGAGSTAKPGPRLSSIKAFAGEPRRATLNADRPSLSVVVASYNFRDTIENVLNPCNGRRPTMRSRS